MEKDYNLRKMQKKLKKHLDKERYQHTLGVMYTSAALAMAYQADIMDAQIAGLLHDCAKCIPEQKKLEMCFKHHIPVSELEQRNPFLLHAKLGAYIAKKKYHIAEHGILSAIYFHTTGRPRMTQLEKIVFIADYIEPMRNKAQRLPQIRQLAFQDLDNCMYEILKDTLLYLEKTPKDIDTATRDAYEYYTSVHRK